MRSKHVVQEIAGGCSQNRAIGAEGKVSSEAGMNPIFVHILSKCTCTKLVQTAA